jgi:hypothetical protein
MRLRPGIDKGQTISVCLQLPGQLGALAHVGCGVLAPPPRQHAAEPDPAERAFLRSVRNRVETLIGQLTGEHSLDDHGARSWWGLHTRLAGGILAAYTIDRYLMALGVDD